MLVLKRFEQNEVGLWFPPSITGAMCVVRVVSIDDYWVKLGFIAPRWVQIERDNVREPTIAFPFAVSGGGDAA